MVTWEDAAQMDDGVWVENKDHAYAPQVHTQVGFLLSRTRKGIVLTSSWNPDFVGARDSIPRGMVRSIEYLEPAPTARKQKAK